MVLTGNKQGYHSRGHTVIVTWAKRIVRNTGVFLYTAVTFVIIKRFLCRTTLNAKELKTQLV